MESFFLSPRSAASEAVLSVAGRSARALSVMQCRSLFQMASAHLPLWSDMCVRQSATARQFCDDSSETDQCIS